jgi:hypothetical protein
MTTPTNGKESLLAINPPGNTTHALFSGFFDAIQWPNHNSST